LVRFWQVSERVAQCGPGRDAELGKDLIQVGPDGPVRQDGNLGTDALADANNAWWSVSSWQERGQMQAYVDSEPHLGISERLDHYCDEATFVDWEQASPALPDWQTSWRHLTADGKAADLTHPSAANQTRDFPAPVQPPLSVS
jgi:hypothetical protein